MNKKTYIVSEILAYIKDDWNIEDFNNLKDSIAGYFASDYNDMKQYELDWVHGNLTQEDQIKIFSDCMPIKATRKCQWCFCNLREVGNTEPNTFCSIKCENRYNFAKKHDFAPPYLNGTLDNMESNVLI